MIWFTVLHMTNLFKVTCCDQYSIIFSIEMSWEHFYGDSRHVTNARVICLDGVIHTHKLVLANLSDLLQNILREIPFGDNVTIYLTDFSKVSVEKYFCDAIQRKETDEKKLHKLLQLNHHESVKKEREPDSEHVKIKLRGTTISKDEPDKNEVKIEAQSSNELNSSDEDGYNNIEAAEADSDFDVEFKGKQVKRKTVTGSDSPTKKVRISTSKKAKEFTLLNPEELDAFDQAMDEKIRSMEGDKIEDPSTASELAFNKRMDTKIRYEKAYAEVKSGRAKSYREAAKRFGVCPQTIRRDDGLLKSEAEKIFGAGLQIETRKFDDASFIENYDKLWKDGDLIGNMDPQELAELDKRTEEVIEGLKRERIMNPSRPQDLAFNKNIDKKIRYEKALNGLKSGRVKTCREAARMFGVCRQSLRNCLKSGKSFTGSGRHMLKFTKEEEETIISRCKSLTDDGQQLTKDALAKLILEEAEVVKINFPDREETMNWLVQSKFQRFVENFAIRNNIVGADFKDQREAKKLFECEVCYQSFGSVSYLIQHKKTLHEFLYTDDDFPAKKPKKEKKWECDICYKRFTTKQSLQQHQKKQHDFYFTQ